MILDEQKVHMLATGGKGTKMFYIAASLTAAGCAVLYVIRRRKTEKQK